MLPKCFLFILLALFWSSPGWADYTGQLQGLNFSGESVPLSDPTVFRPIDQNLVLLAEAKSRVWLTLRRAMRFLPVVESILKENGVPADFKYVAMGTTSLNPIYAVGGRGIWRFPLAEAKLAGLRVDKNIDERLDPVASTLGAARMFKRYKEKYGSWTMAMAAHLIGEEVLQLAIDDAGGQRDYYKIYLPQDVETLPAMVLAGKAVFSHPEAFGYRQATAGAWPPLATKRVTVPTATTARALAAQYKQDYKTFRDMNPHLISGTVPAGVSINIP